MRLPSLLNVLIVAVVFAGCTSSNGSTDGTTPTGTMTMSPPPPPKEVFSKEVNQCLPNAPVQTAAIGGKFSVPDGYDQIIIGYHESGLGRVTVSLRSLEENKVVWEVRDKIVNTLVPGGTMCGGHSHEGDGITKDVDAGEYELTINYLGTVGLHVDITAKSSHGNDTGMQHMH